MIVYGNHPNAPHQSSGIRAATVDKTGKVRLDGPVEVRVAATLEDALAGGRAMAGVADALIGVGRLEDGTFWYSALATTGDGGRTAHAVPQSWGVLADRDRGKPGEVNSLIQASGSALLALTNAKDTWVREPDGVRFTRQAGRAAALTA
jgi:hypothetical protein